MIIFACRKGLYVSVNRPQVRRRDFNDRANLGRFSRSRVYARLNRADIAISAVDNKPHFAAAFGVWVHAFVTAKRLGYYAANNAAIG